MQYLFISFSHILHTHFLTFGIQDNYSHFSEIIHNISVIKEWGKYILLYSSLYHVLLLWFLFLNDFWLNSGEVAHLNAYINVEVVSPRWMAENMMALISNNKDSCNQMIFIMKSILNNFINFSEIVKKIGKFIGLRNLKEYIPKRKSNIILIHI